ncbi:MAG: GNAT family N-acetyltransferase [Ilumatobacteraceae bacterium]|nr:GNAT family N-acetyltransferase [Ilumatobacteraceae bacterium]
MLLRGYRSDDLDAVHAINEAEVPAVGSVTRDELAHIASEASIALVAEFDGVVAGFCLVLAPGADYGSSNFAWFAERYDDFVYLDRVAISPAFQRRGIGRALYAEVERVAPDRCHSARDFLLEVNLRPRNDQSLAFHAGLGFVEVGRRDTDYGVTVSMLAKPLTAARSAT